MPVPGKVVIKAVSQTTRSDFRSQQQYRLTTGKVACKLSSTEYAEFIASVFRQVSRPVETYPGEMIVAHATRLWPRWRSCVTW